MALSFPLDGKLAASINRRRISEEFRKKRIFDAKQRQIGIDIDALSYQVHDKAFERAREAEREKHFAEELRWQIDVSEAIVNETEENTRELNKKIDEFRLTEQRPENRRDFDLYDPNQKKKERPPRTSDKDHCPVSGLQKFEGEDLNYRERSKKQKEQMRDLLFQQMQEKRMLNYKTNKEIHNWESQVLQMDRNARAMNFSELDHCKKIATDLQNINKSLAMDVLERKMKKKQEEEIANKEEIWNTFHGDLLSENPAVARSAFGPHRVVPDRWKGMSKKQLEEYYSGQIEQIIEKKRKKEQEQHETARWNEQIKQLEDSTELLDEEEERQRFEEKKSIALKNHELAQQQRQKNEYLNKIVYANDPTDDYYAQFNTTSR